MNMCYKIAAYQGVSGTEAGLTIAADGERTMADAQHAREIVYAQEITCTGCGETKAGTAYYVSNRSRCKECVRASVRANRAKRGDYYRAYDRRRYREDPKRRENARRSAKSPAGRAAQRAWLEYSREYEPEKWKARSAVNNAIRAGRLRREPCYFCGSDERLHAHHEDYCRPLDVLWLCSSCHGKLHAISGDFHRVP